MRALTVREQIADMRAAWPAFTARVPLDWCVVWEGRVRPLQRTYSIRVEYALPHVSGGIRYGGGQPNPSVTVLDPLLQPREPGGLIEHAYPNTRSPDHAELCLEFYIDAEWTPDMSIARTTVPWACHWLDTYECWRVTGRWQGGGMHYGDEDFQEWLSKNQDRQRAPPSQERLARDEIAALSSRGRKAAYSVSLASMGEALRASTPLASWP